MNYPDARDITDPAPTLPPEVAAELAPLVQQAQRRYRRFRQNPSDYAEEPQIVIDHAADVFRTLAARELRARTGSFEEFRARMDIETGAADMALRYAHHLYNNVQRGRMLAIWHHQIRSSLLGLISDAEDLWWNPEVIPAGWEPFLLASPAATARHAGVYPGAPPSGTSPTVDAERKTPAEFFEAYCTAHPGVTYEVMSDLIGISRDTLFKIKNEKAWVRFYAYDAAAQLLGCKPEHLHPVSLPRQRRRVKAHGKKRRSRSPKSD